MSEHRGRVSDFPEDNMLAEFGGVVDAMKGRAILNDVSGYTSLVKKAELSIACGRLGQLARAFLEVKY